MEQEDSIILMTNVNMFAEPEKFDLMLARGSRR